MFPKWHPASPNIGDAATAFVVGATERPGIVATHAVTDGTYYEAVCWARGRKNDKPWWQEGPRFFMGSLDPEKAGKLVQDTVRLAATTLDELAARSRESIGTVDVFASVQPRQWIPLAIAETVGIPLGHVVQTFPTYAHLGCCGPVVNLSEARARGMLHDGARVALYAQGGGFTRAAALLSWAGGARAA
jgi:3-oxoacyl-[acyl-carrier-protein] synthase III